MDARELRRRAISIIALFTSGETLQAIGDEFGISRERVRQILRYYGYKGKHGGIAKSNKVNENYGMTESEMREVRAKYPGCTKAYRRQQRSAAQRGIEWDMSFKDWVSMWEGLWDRRGRGHGLVMCRRKDQGPYKVGNVFIAMGSFNNAAYAMRKWHGIDIDDDPYYTAMIV